MDDDFEREEMMFRLMFNTAFIQSNVLLLNREEIDTVWNAKDQFPKDFKAEVGVCFSYILVSVHNMIGVESTFIPESGTLFRLGCC